MKGMILAAGLGTRLKPFTDKHPKALAVVNGKTLLQRNIEYLKSFGIHEIIINVHHFAEQIYEHCRENKGFGAHLTFSDETDMVLETGGGLLKAAWFFKSHGPFVLMNTDVLTDLDLAAMVDFHLSEKPMATLAVSKRDTSRYFLFDKSDRLCGWENVKTKEQKISRQTDYYIAKAFSGIQVISDEIFDMIDLRGKFSMVDVYLHIAKTRSILGYDHTSRRFIDVGKPESLEQAGKLFE